ncbi:MAG: hypothetical protein QGH74_02195 [Candidatus Brocadiia bacterium]|jgi:hypothetical protein|nr:hypothetical protein [Candidatus Brocadiia bacterium]
MAKGHHLTPYQKGVVRRYYDNKEAITYQKVAEIVSELYVCEDDKKAARLWKSVHKALLDLDAPKARVERLVANRDLEDLAKLAGSLWGT